VAQSWRAEALFYCRSTRPSAHPGGGGGFVRAFAGNGGRHPHVCLCTVPWPIDAQGEGRVPKGRFVSQALELKEALKRRAARDSVFINVPFDKPRIPIYLGLISGIVALGLKPRCVLEIPPTHDRLRRLYQLIRGSRYSIHDLSRVQLSGSMRVPRFNMPFELGLSVAVHQQSGEHEWRVYDDVFRPNSFASLVAAAATAATQRFAQHRPTSD